jgi:tetratricopeptide (TPR) repeat protein
LACTRIINDPTEAVVDRVLAYLQRGNMYAINDTPDLAIVDYSEAIKLDPRNVLAYASRAIAYSRNGDRQHAIADFRLAKETDPSKISEMTAANAELREIGSAAAQAPVAVISTTDSDQCGDVNNVERADVNIAACDRILNDPKATSQSRAMALSGRCARRDFDRATADLTEAIQLNPELANAYGNRGNAYYGKQDYDRALADYNEAMRHDPKNPHSYANRGNVYAFKKDHAAAIEDYDMAIRLDSSYAVAYYNRGLAKKARGDTAEGEVDILRAKQLNPDVGK